jgi:integral membrane sensor domain MASE1
VSAAEVKLGSLPALPVLAGLPAHPLSGWASLLLGVPVAAALVAGWLLAHRALRNAPAEQLRGAFASGDDWTRLLASSAIAGPVAGGLLGLAGLASGGSLGDQHLAVIGPHAGMVALIATMVVAIGAALAASATKIFLGVRRSRS